MPSGRGIRPTGARVREAMFDVLAHGKIPLPLGVNVVDCFAGTGALGFEALSRGATRVTFLDTRRSARQLIRTSAARLGVTERIDILNRDALRPLGPPTPCQLALLDPPYGANLAPRALASMSAEGWLSDGAVAALELSIKDEFAAPAGFSVLTSRVYGSTRLIILAWRAGDATNVATNID